MGSLRVWAGLAGLTAMAALILGYHPYAEDGGIYLAEIKRAADPALYPAWGKFAAGHMGPVPGFADAVGWLARSTGWSVDWIVAVVHLGSLFATLAGVWGLAAACYERAEARWGAVALTAFCCGLPVAGTSLMLVDPYATARSVALAATVAGVAGVLAGRRWLTLAALCIALAAHPLMGAYGAVAAGVLWCTTRGWPVWWVSAAALLGAALVQASRPPEMDGYARVAATRYYWFLAEWHWYEWAGLIAPLCILASAGWKRRGLARDLARMAVMVGGTAAAVAGCFAREASRVYLVARLQPLRCFQLVYLVMLVVIGAWLAERVLRAIWWRWGVGLVLLAGGMTVAQRAAYPASQQLEMPWARATNRWEQAFLWVKANTPRDALFALDADYVHRAGEDAQGFRAIAERSALPDYSKDGGQAAIRPELTEAWAAGQAAQAGLSDETDAERLSKLRPLGVTWVVMGRDARTEFACPYSNEAVKVCRLGE